MPNKRPTITEQIRQAILDCGESRYSISKQTEISEPVLSRFVSGERGMSLKALDKLCEHLKLEVRKRGKN